MIQTAVYLHEFSESFSRFKGIIGERHWLRRVNALEIEIKGFPYLKDYLFEENELAYALDECSKLFIKYGVIPRRQRENVLFYPAIAFITQVLSFLENISDVKQRASFIRRVQGAFSNPDDLRALKFEFTVATHFINRGYQISWPELGASGASTDILVHGIGVDCLEVECKSVSHEKGKKILRREALEFFNIIRPKLISKLNKQLVREGISAVVTVPLKLPKDIKNRVALADKVISSIMKSEEYSDNDGNRIDLSKFDLSLVEPLISQPVRKDFRKCIDNITSTDNREAMIFGNNKGAILLVLQSSSDDSVLNSIFNTLRDSAKRQPSKTRAAAYMVGFTGISPKELEGIANQDFDQNQPPTGLSLGVTHFFQSNSYDHLVGLGFLSNGAINEGLDGTYTDSGSAYFFPHKESKFWHSDFSSLFGIHEAKIP